MLTRLSRDVICVKGVQSNLIEEVFFILKNSDVDDSKNSKKRKEIAMLEINEMIDDYSKKFKEDEKIKLEERRRINRIKSKALVFTFAFIICCLIIALIKK